MGCFLPLRGWPCTGAGEAVFAVPAAVATLRSRMFSAAITSALDLVQRRLHWLSAGGAGCAAGRFAAVWAR